MGIRRPGMPSSRRRSTREPSRPMRSGRTARDTAPATTSHGIEVDSARDRRQRDPTMEPDEMLDPTHLAARLLVERAGSRSAGDARDGACDSGLALLLAEGR